MIALLRRLLYVLRRPQHDADLRDEIEVHRALRQEALERDGLAPADAARASRRALGNVSLAVDDARDVWALRTLDCLRHDIRTAIRGLRKSPVFALIAIGTLALGIGANSALFSIFNSLILRPLPVRDPGGLALLAGGSWTYPIWEEARRIGDALFDGTVAWAEETFDLSQGGQTDLVDGAYVSGRFFDVLGVTAVRGRMLTTTDEDPAAPNGPVVVISHRFWQRHFAGAADVIGRTLTLQQIPFTVVGVMPAGFAGLDVGRTADLMVPFAVQPILHSGANWLTERSTWWVEIIARLKPDQSLEQANAALRGVQPRIRAATIPDWPEAMRARYLDEPFTLVPAATGKSELRQRFETPLFAMMVAVGLVLLIACANIASLLLARALVRRRELSVRLALGATRWHVARLLFIESLLVATSGAAVGLVFAKWSSALLVQQLSTWQGAIVLDLALDWRVLTFTAAAACLSAVVAGVAPVVGLKSVAPAEAFKDTGRGIAGDRRFALRGALVVAQVALSLVLVVAAGLFLRTFTTLSRVPLGFTPEPLLIVDANLSQSSVPPEERGALVMRMLDAATGVPGVRSAAAAQLTPISGAGWNNWVGDSAAPPSDRSFMVWHNAVTPGWFATMGIPLLSGRDFDAGDRRGATLVAVVNESFVRRFLPGRPPLGQSINTGPDWRFEIVGVVADAVYRRPREGMVPTMYLALAQRPPFPRRVALTVAAATPGQRAALERDVAGALTQVDPSVTFTFRTFDQLVGATRTQERLVAMLSAFFGTLALLLAGVGLYGIVAHAVRARRTEIGLRMALGAVPSSIVRLVFRRVGILLAAGLALGLTAGLWAAQYIESMLFHLPARDTATFAGAAAVLVVVGCLAAWAPAQRAARLDPARVLRDG
ncbi:MAG: ABC transporter permease [Acidobacteria bacterium]|nr:ABC transporter permease [Acidobacteriota bacterium]